MAGWIGVDLDGTLAEYDHWRGGDHIGEPVPPMLKRVKKWIDDGVEVRIFTARAALGKDFLDVLKKWLVDNVGQELPITNVKDFDMIEMWDDRAVTVQHNTGTILSLNKLITNQNSSKG